MRRFFFILIVIVFLFMIGCSDKTVDKEIITGKHEYTKEIKVDEVIEIKEDMFLTQIDDIFYNFDEYKDRTVKVQGIYSEIQPDKEVEGAPVVFRNGPGCCGNDGWGGFYLEIYGPKPNKDDWIEVVGVPIMKETEAGDTLWLQVNSIEVLEERGEEMVLR